MMKKIDISEHTLVSSKLPIGLDGITVCHVSDFHSNKFADLSSELINAVKMKKPDIIVVSGDMTDCSKDRTGEYFFSFADRVDKNIPIVCSAGNHEKRIGKQGNPEEFVNGCRERGIEYLDNARCEVTVRNEKIAVYGYLQDFYSFKEEHEKRSRLRQDITAEDIEKAIGKCPQNDFCILLAHDPMMFEAYVQWGAPLTFSGHIHGGVVRLPFVGGLLSPARKFFPKYDAGIFKKDESAMIVSRGLSVAEIPRIFNRPEIAFIKLKSGKAQK